MRDRVDATGRHTGSEIIIKHQERWGGSAQGQGQVGLKGGDLQRPLRIGTDHWLGGSQRSHQGLPMSWGWKNVTAAIAAMETRGERWVWKRTLSVWPSMCLNGCFSVVLELRRLTVVKPCQKGRGDKSEQGFPETALTVSTHTATSAAPLLLSHLAPSQGWPFGPVSPSLGKRMTSLTSSPIHCPESRVSPKDLCTEILLEMWSQRI